MESELMGMELTRRVTRLRVLILRLALGRTPKLSGAQPCCQRLTIPILSRWRGLNASNPPLVFGQGLVEALFGGGVAGDVVRGVDVELHPAVG